MERAFDLRLSADREALADLLPTIDNKTYGPSKQEFINALTDLATFLENPEWMIYQWGAFRPISSGKIHLQFGLTEALELGLQLRRLSSYENFDQLLKGFFNPTQFQDSQFETKVAYFFSNLLSIQKLRFSPEYVVRGQTKRPEFDAIREVGPISVECKRPHLHVQKANQKFQRAVDELKSAMEAGQWPSHLRLEVEFIESKPVSTLASKVIERALKVANNNKREFHIGPIHGFVVGRTSPFQLTKVRLGTDIMILDKQIPTGLSNPEFTALRVINNRLDSQFAKSVGVRVREALRQLPEAHDCLIFIGDVPFRIAEKVCQRRLNRPSYSHIRAFGIWEGEIVRFIYRETDREFIEKLD